MKICNLLLFLTLTGIDFCQAQFFQFKEHFNSGINNSSRFSYVYKNKSSRFHFFDNMLEVLNSSNSDKNLKQEIFFQASPNFKGITPQIKKAGSCNFFRGEINYTHVEEFSCLLYENYIPGISMLYFENERNELEHVIINTKELSLWLNKIKKSQGETKESSIACSNWSTYYGGNKNEKINGITHDAAGNIYLTGTTQSDNFSIVPGMISDTIRGTDDAFVIKMDSCGNRIWATYLGSSQFDSGEKIVKTENNTIVLCGYTLGTDFPVTIGSMQDTSKGSYDTFITKLDSTGNLVWSTYFGGTNADFAYDLASDVDYNIYVGGSTLSVDLPTVAGAFQQNKSGAIDAYVLKLDSLGQLKWCTYYGGSGTEDVHAITCDKSKNTVLVGGTFSNNLNTSASAFQSFNNGGMDIYMLKLDSAGNRVFSTYVGGIGIDDTYGIVCAPNNDIYFTGNTTSNDFPVTTGCYQNNNAGATDIHLSKFSPSGAQMWSTYVGGTDIEETRGIVYENNELILIGRTSSSDIPILATPLQSNLNGVNFDAYIIKFSLNGVPFWSTYYGGSNEEISEDITNIGNDFFICGSTYSSDYPVSFGAFQTTADAFGDGFISRLHLQHSLTGIIESEIADEINLMPNPSSNCFYLSSMKQLNSTLNLFDASGRKVLEQNLQLSIEPVFISTQALESGVYFAEINSENKIFRKKIIISN